MDLLHLKSALLGCTDPGHFTSKFFFWGNPNLNAVWSFMDLNFLLGLHLNYWGYFVKYLMAALLPQWTTGVNTSKILASSKETLCPLWKKQFSTLYFQITGLANDRPSSFFEEPSSVIFEEVKCALHDGSDSWRMSIWWTNQTIWFSFYIFT